MLIRPETGEDHAVVWGGVGSGGVRYCCTAYPSGVGPIWLMRNGLRPRRRNWMHMRCFFSWLSLSRADHWFCWIDTFRSCFIFTPWLWLLMMTKMWVHFSFQMGSADSNDRSQKVAYRKILNHGANRTIGRRRLWDPLGCKDNKKIGC